MLTLERTHTMAPAAATDIPLGALLAACDTQPETPMGVQSRQADDPTRLPRRRGEGRTVRRPRTRRKPGSLVGYPHPLRDVTEGDRTQMTVGKFAAIIRTVS
jgi:hypothetical protein